MKKSTSWGSVAGWYDKHLAEKDTYHSAVILPNLLRLVAPKKGMYILDLACGQGFFSRAFAAKGARVTGADISAELIMLAKKQTITNIDYLVASAENIKAVKNTSIDAVTIVLALQNIENMSGALKECSRVLKLGGKLFLVLNHPAFRIPQRSDWQYDATKKVQYRRVEQYLSEAKIKIDMHPGSDPSEHTISFHRPLQVYFKTLANAGFVVSRLEEWTSHTKTPHGPRAAAENRARQEIPLFLMLEAEK